MGHRSKSAALFDFKVISTTLPGQLQLIASIISVMFIILFHILSFTLGRMLSTDGSRNEKGVRSVVQNVPWRTPMGWGLGGTVQGW